MKAGRSRGTVFRLVGIGLLVLIAAAIFRIETHHSVPHFRLCTFALVFLFFAIATPTMPGPVRPILMIVCSLGFGLAMIEAYAVWQTPKTLFASTETPGIQIPAPVVGWDNGKAGVYRARHVDPVSGALIFDATYTIDKDHDRSTKAANDGRSIVFWGASFTFGHGLGDADTLPQRFADLLGGKRKVLNFGVGGYSPAQVLREMQTGYKDGVIGPHPLAFVMLTGAFHSVRTSCRESWTATAPRFEKKGGKLVHVGACREGLALTLQNFLDTTASYQLFIQPREPRETRDGIAVYIDIVAEIARLAKSKYGVDLLVPYVGGPVETPQNLHDKQVGVVPTLAYFPGTGWDGTSVIAALRQRGVHVVDMTLRDDAMAGHVIAIPNDNHPTPYANERRAAMTREALNALGVSLEAEDPPASARN